MNLDTPIAPLGLPEVPTSTADVVMGIVTDESLAAMLLTLSNEIPNVGLKVTSATADQEEFSRPLLSLQVAITLVGLRMTYADPDPDSVEIDQPTTADTFHDQCTLAAYHTRTLGFFLLEGLAYAEQFRATVNAGTTLLPWLSKLADALANPEAGK